MSSSAFSRRRFLRASGALGALAMLQRLAPAYAQAPGGPHAGHAGMAGMESMGAVADGAGKTSAYDLAIDRAVIDLAGTSAAAVTVNGTVPGPLLRFREGDEALIRVSNRLHGEDTSIHWHGLLLPAEMDGVPGVSFAGIKPGETFTYRFPLKQSGTYWYHSHSGFQEQLGVFGPLIIDPREPEPYAFDREYVVLLSDWTFTDPHLVYSRLKKQANYYNRQRRTLPDLVRDAGRDGWSAALASRREWARMRMDPTDIADLTGATYTYLVNGLPPAANWTGLFHPGERVRLRFINASAATYFDVRIPGLPMTVVQADGNDVQPVTVDEFRIAVAETYDVIVEPSEDRAYTLFAETMDRGGYAAGTLAPRRGMAAALPVRRARPLRTMADMGMDHGSGAGSMAGMPGMAAENHSGHGSTPPPPPAGKGHDMAAMADMPQSTPASTPAVDHSTMAGMGDMPGMKMPAAPAASGEHAGMAMPPPSAPAEVAAPVPHGPDNHGPGNSMVAMSPRNRLHERGTGLEDAPHRVLVYTDLRSVRPRPEVRPPDREIELHITGNMERYIWGFDGKTFSEAPAPIAFKLGERVRLTFVNDTMMDHPMHLHGMWSEPENGAGAYRPKKHTINVKPAERLSLDIEADAPGFWAMHCHILYHMEAGMFRVVSVA
ncbi:MAG: copper resistance system multicopper oxidase [Verrucomicrobiota bacterium]